MRSLLLLLLLLVAPALLASTSRPPPPWNVEPDKNDKKDDRYGKDTPYTLCPVGSLVDWRPYRVASLAHVTVQFDRTDERKTRQLPKTFDDPFAAVEYGRTCVLTLGFTARESRPVVAYVGTQIPALLETTLTGYYRLTRDPRNLKNTETPDMAVFYSMPGKRQQKGNCFLHRDVQHVQFTSKVGFYFIVCYGDFEDLMTKATRKNIEKASKEVEKELFVDAGKPHKKGLKWSHKKVNLTFLDPASIKKRLGKVMEQLREKHGHWVNPTEFEGWPETIMPHFDLRTVIYESYYKKVRTEAQSRLTSRFITTTALYVFLVIAMEGFARLLRKYLL